MKWKDIKVGDTLKDGSRVTQVHRTHSEPCCKLIYDNDQELICSYRHILLVDVHELPKKGLKELNKSCTFVPLEEDFEVSSIKPLAADEQLVVQEFLNNADVPVQVDCIQDAETEIYDFHFESETKRVYVKNVIIKKEPQKVDDTTFWLTCNGIEYLMKKYKNVNLYCNGLILNSIEPMGDLPCFCVSTNTGRYET